MCGIAGYIRNADTLDDDKTIAVLLDSIRQRGPDDEGVCLIDRSTRAVFQFGTGRTVPDLQERLNRLTDHARRRRHDIGLLHTRYAIIDLSERGHQPFVTEDDSIVCITNGEIYNYLELRTELERLGIRFRTDSDTEVLVQGYFVWGNELWPRLNGFWAAALYDRRDNTFVLSRDRIGVAPLYVRDTAQGLYFASTITGLLDIPPATRQTNEEALIGFVQTGMKDLDDTTCFTDVRSFPAASYAVFDADACRLASAKVRRYWDLPKQRLRESDLTLRDAVQRFRDLFFNAVEVRLRADVKIGFELSGGLDSSSIVAAAAALGRESITTYTIRVPERNEEPYARSILKTCSVDYNVLEGGECGFREEAENFASVMEEPYHSPNIYTHFHMRRLMKRAGASVVLSGSGGDEALAGYEFAFWEAAQKELKRNGRAAQAAIYSTMRNSFTRERMKRSLRGALRTIRRYTRRRQELAQPRTQPSTPTRALSCVNQYSKLSFHEQMLYHFKIAMIPYWLRSNDHFTMAIPLEHRFPFLDYRIVELGCQLPVGYLFKNGYPKYVLRKAMEPYLPHDIVWRKEKMGFPFAMDRFLADYRLWFMPLIAGVLQGRIPESEVASYETLLRSNPAKLWRLCSCALWMEALDTRSSAA